MASSHLLDETLTADGQTSVVDPIAREVKVAAYGTFSGGTASFQVSYDGGTTWFDADSSASFTSDGDAKITVPPGVKLRGNLTGSSSGVSVTFTAVEL